MRIAVHNSRISIITLLIVIFQAVIASCNPAQQIEPIEFDGMSAFNYLANQVKFGPRIPGSNAHQKTIDYIIQELQKENWRVSVQELELNGKNIFNLCGEHGNGNHWILLGAHYDSRIKADRDADTTKQMSPVSGANDGASGVALLLELARVVPRYDNSNLKISLVFFDGEDNGNIDQWEWLMGSTAYVEGLKAFPEKVVIVDMIGDEDLQIYREVNSDQALTDQIWKTAEKLGYSSIFINKYKYNMLDDHIPFVRAGIAAIDIIDFDYPFWHTAEDTFDKVSPRSLKIVGDTLLNWLINQ